MHWLTALRPSRDNATEENPMTAVVAIKHKRINCIFDSSFMDAVMNFYH